MVSILIVCLGNICRSPSAEGILRARLRDTGIDGVTIDSAGTGNWHTGNPPDRRAIAAARARGIDISDLRARQVTLADFDRFDLIVAMDRSNLSDLKALAPRAARARLAMMTDFSSRYDGDVPDPYFGGTEGFTTMLDTIDDACKGLIETLKSS